MDSRKSINSLGSTQADQLEIIFYTDPLCCWSWGIEPQMRKLMYLFRGQISWRFCMGGMLPGWQNYNDEVNSVSRPLQMGPVWMHAQEVSGMPMQSAIWMKDPPASSYPSCIAVKCAGIQSAGAGERYLRLLREAVMLEGKNIAREEVLIEVAEKLLSEGHYEFDIEMFKADLKNDNGLEAFRKDVQESQQRNISRFPTMIMKYPGRQGIMLTGYRPYAAILESVKHMAPELIMNDEIDTEEYTRYWGSLTSREAAEIKKADQVA